MADDALRYDACQDLHEDRFEALCKRCGQCCGSTDGDPCRELRQDPVTQSYYCAEYAHRLGRHTTVNGKEFTCVPIRDVARRDGLRPGCGYRM